MEAGREIQARFERFWHLLLMFGEHYPRAIQFHQRP